MYITSSSRTLPHRLMKTFGLQSKHRSLFNDKTREIIEEIYSIVYNKKKKLLEKTRRRRVGLCTPIEKIFHLIKCSLKTIVTGMFFTKNNIWSHKQPKSKRQLQQSQYKHQY